MRSSDFPALVAVPALFVVQGVRALEHHSWAPLIGAVKGFGVAMAASLSFMALVFLLLLIFGHRTPAEDIPR